MSIRKAKLKLQNLKVVVAPKWPPRTYLRIQGETEGEALARYDIAEWPEDAQFIHLSRADILKKAQGQWRVQAELGDGTTLTFTVLQVNNAGLALIGLDPKLLRK
jgi:hypothetical protein